MTLNRFRHGFCKWLKDYRFLHLFVVVYILVLTSIVLLRHYSFDSSAWDLGIFDQACYTTLHGKVFYTTAEIYANPSGSIFGTHFSPMLLVVLPFYAVFPVPETLLIIQTIVLAIGAYPVFFIAKEILGNGKLGLYFSLLYLAFPHVHSINVFDFHPDALFVTLSLVSLYFFIRGKWKPYVVFMILSFLTKESMPIMFFFFAIGELILLRDQVVDSLKKRKISSRRLSVVVFTMVIAICYYVVARQIVHSINPSPSGFVEGSPWSVLGVNPLDPSTLVHLTGINLSGAIGFDFQLKLFYLITVLAPLAFLPVFRLSRFLPVIAWLALAFLSNYPPYYSLGWQYSALIVPFAVVAAIEGFHTFGSAFKLEKDRLFSLIKKLLLVGVLSTLALTFLILPINTTGLSWISEHDEKLNAILSWIKEGSPNASILTQYDIFPHVSNRVNSYVIPPIFSAFKKDYYFKYVKSLFEMGIDYVILDLNPDVRTHAHRVTHFAALRSIEETGTYGLYASVDGILVYKLGYSGDLVKYEAFAIYNKYNAGIAYDTTLFSYTLPRGEYNVTYAIKISPAIRGNAFTIEIRQAGETLTSLKVSGTEFKNAEEYRLFSVTLRNPSSSADVEFLITNLSTATEVTIDYMKICLKVFEIK